MVLGMNIQRIIRRAKLAFRLLIPRWAELYYVRDLKRSGLFDRQFYRSTNPTLHPLFKRFPERHFVQYGERLGLWPNPDFSPPAYLRHNPDLDGQALSPFQHYVRYGRHEGRLTKDIPQELVASDIDTPKLRALAGQKAAHAIVIHVYYPDLWDEFSQILKAVSFDYDLYVTLTWRGPESEKLQAQIEAGFPSAKVVLVRNHGRDIFPFLLLVNAGWLDGYEAVCKLHTKKSPHRSDGEEWRRHLIAGVLGGENLTQRLEKFKADPKAAFWVADGQHFTGTEWWGSNFDKVASVLRRVEIGCDPAHLSFPAGSIYWAKPLMIDMIRSLHLSEDLFEPETGQTDGTLAHAVERALGALAEAADMRIRQTSEIAQQEAARKPKTPDFVSAFYLPQFHPVPENDAWWGKGFTEWVSVTRAKPQFAGHAQPYLPTDLGFYDLRLTDVMGQQADMARKAGINAFCVYHYWFDGQRILEEPIDRLLQRPEIDFPFYLCWANEAWRRNWDGMSGEVLLDQPYSAGFEKKLAKSLVRYFNDPRYQRPDGKRPRFVIYRPEDLPNPAMNIARLREAWKELGVGDVELGAVRFHVPGQHPVQSDVFDFWIEMPPHGVVGEAEYLFGGPQGNQMPTDVSPGFSGLAYDYRRLPERTTGAEYLRTLPPTTIAGIMPSWDNTARRGTTGHIAWGANPATFEKWLRLLCRKRLSTSYRGELFINAWNEWAEKAVLEPNAIHGHAYLRVLERVIGDQEHINASETAENVKRISVAAR